MPAVSRYCGELGTTRVSSSDSPFLSPSARERETFEPTRRGLFNRATLRDGQRPPVYLGDALGDDVIRERGELLLQLVEQLHDSDVRAVALPHRGPPSSWQGLYLQVPYVYYRYISSSVSSEYEK